MGLFDFFKKNNASNTQQSQSQSKYENLPLINPQEDKNTPKGYVERTFITEEKISQICDNIFRDSNLPIVAECKSATRFLSTMVLQEKSGKRVRSVTESIFYIVPSELQTEYVKLLGTLNNILIANTMPAQYLYPLNQIVFCSADTTYHLPKSIIEYIQDKNEFHYIYRNEIANKGPSKHSITTYETTNYACLVYSDNGTFKKADFTINIHGKDAKIRFKGYKTGIELYDIRYNGDIVYKRETK